MEQRAARFEHPGEVLVKGSPVHVRRFAQRARRRVVDDRREFPILEALHDLRRVFRAPGGEQQKRTMGSINRWVKTSVQTMVPPNSLQSWGFKFQGASKTRENNSLQNPKFRITPRDNVAGKPLVSWLHVGRLMACFCNNNATTSVHVPHNLAIQGCPPRSPPTPPPPLPLPPCKRE